MSKSKFPLPKIFTLILVSNLISCAQNPPPPQSLPNSPVQPKTLSTPTPPAPPQDKISAIPLAGLNSTKAPTRPLRVAFAYVGPIGNEGWTYAHDLGRQAVEREFGKAVQITYVEKVREGPGGENVFRQLVAQGNTLIFGTTFGYMKPLLQVAQDSPTVKFEHATGYITTENLRVYDVRSYEGAYLAGVLAGSVSKSKVLGVVASIPIPEVIRNINSFTLGARSVQPSATVKVVWANSWYDPVRERLAANTLMDGGADVLMQTTDSTEVLQAAEQRGRRAIGWDSDMSEFAPKAHLASAIVNFGPYYIKAVRDVLNGTWSSQATWWGVKDGAVDLVAVAEDVPPEVRQRIELIKAGLKSGSFNIWKGPIWTQSGELFYAANNSAPDEELKGMAVFVKGVVGPLPR